MSNDNDGWGTVEVSEGNAESTQVAFEIEEEENLALIAKNKNISKRELKDYIKNHE